MIRGGSALQPDLPELLFNGRAICLRRPASEILDVESGQGKMILQREESDVSAEHVESDGRMQGHDVTQLKGREYVKFRLTSRFFVTYIVYN